ncbi:MAG: VCBS repeat-containing protein [Planctomycetes bacterium]|nr:VCBS repeat-containing protein [Planctomycetota bacterium]
MREKAARFFNLQQPEYGSAREALKPLVERKDARLEDLVGAAAIEYADGKLEPAAAFLARAAKLDAKAPGVRFLEGQLARENGDFQAAREHFRAALAAAPGDAPTKIALAEAEHECGDPKRAEELYREVVELGIENGQQWYVTAVFRMTRLLVDQDGRESDLAKYNALFTQLTARKLTAPDSVTLGLGNLGRMRAPKPAGNAVAKPTCPPALALARTELPELAGAKALEAWDVDGDLELDLVAWGSTGVRVALRRDGGWKIVTLPADVVRVYAAFDLDNAASGASWLSFVVEDAGKVALYHPDPETEAWSRWPLELPSTPSLPIAIAAVDVDHEGDVDLVVAGTFGARFWRNDGANVLAKEAKDGAPATPAGRFTDATEGAGLPTNPLQWCLAEDFDGDNDVDLLFGGRNSVLLADSLRACKFRDVTTAVFGASTPSGPVLAADFDGDARVDLWTTGAFWRQTPERTFRREPTSSAPVPPDRARPRAIDLDLDGALDVLEPSTENLALAHLAPGLPTATSCTLGRAGTPAAHDAPIVAGDFDGDKAIELAVPTSAGVQFLTYPSAGRGVRLSYRGLRDNRRAVGAVVELKAGPIYRRFYWRGNPELAGVGKQDKVDVLRITWPNGIVQTELDLDLKPKAGVDDADAAFSGMTQPNTLYGSCPFLYTWNGSKYVFVTDVLGITPLGLPIAPGVFVPPDHDEYVLVKGEELAPKDGTFELHFTEELREVTYLDHAKLLVVDHPEGTEVFPNERFTFPPFPEHHVHTVKDALAPAKATGSDGKDWTKELAAIDDAYAVPFTREAPQFVGLAKPWFVELAFDKEQVARAKKLRLVMTGWFFWSDASANMASAGTPDVRFVPPLFQVPDGKGGWRDAGPPVGFPAGKTKTMVLDVGSILAKDDPRIRVFSTLQLFWDSIRLATDGDDAPLAVQELPVQSAKLWMRGFSAPLERRGAQEWTATPERFDWHHLAQFPRWNQHPGLYTKFGDVLPLTQAIDDQFVILGSGDALTLSFDATKVTPPASGMRRDYLVFLDGWAKDRDPNTVQALEVEPLPFHGMSGYPYGANERFPDDEVHRAWRAEWNTRPAHEWIAPVSPVREEAWLFGRP